MSKISTLFVALAILTGAAVLTTPAFAVGGDDPQPAASNPDYDNAVRAVKRVSAEDDLRRFRGVR